MGFSMSRVYINCLVVIRHGSFEITLPSPKIRSVIVCNTILRIDIDSLAVIDHGSVKIALFLPKVPSVVVVSRMMGVHLNCLAQIVYGLVGIGFPNGWGFLPQFNRIQRFRGFAKLILEFFPFLFCVFTWKRLQILISYFQFSNLCQQFAFTLLAFLVFHQKVTIDEELTYPHFQNACILFNYCYNNEAKSIL